MNREKLIWTVLFVLGGLFLLYRAGIREHGMGQAYVKEVRVKPSDPEDLRTWWVKTRLFDKKTKQIDPSAKFSVSRTIGIWVAAFFTLAVFSFLYRDNVFYKLAESVMVGTTAGYAMVTGFWDAIVGNLMAKLTPGIVRSWALPGTPKEEVPNLFYLVPCVLGAMLLMRLSRKGAWISRWPLAFIVGTTAGLKLVGYLDADFVNQIRSTIIPLVVVIDGQFHFWLSLRNVALVSGVLACLVHFFFSVEHSGLAGRISRVGIWFLMITFGASFGFTVMGRIALLAIRLQFLFDDWLWLIDPAGKRPPGW